MMNTHMVNGRTWRGFALACLLLFIATGGSGFTCSDGGSGDQRIDLQYSVRCTDDIGCKASEYCDISVGICKPAASTDAGTETDLAEESGGGGGGTVEEEIDYASLCIPNAFGVTYYVDALRGSDSDDGLTEATAWKSIARVNKATFEPGDCILFRRGHEWKEQLNIASSGTQEHPIVFSNYSTGNLPVINGAEEAGPWQKTSGDVFQHKWKADMGSTRGVSFTKDGNVKLLTRSDKDDGSGKIKGNIDQGEWYWDKSTGNLYVNVGEDPSGGIVEIVRKNNCILMKGQKHVVIDGLHLEKSSVNNLRIEDSDHITINAIESFYAGHVSVLFIKTTDSLISNCTIKWNFNDGIYLTDYSTDCVIRDSTVSYNGLGWYGDRNGIGLGGNLGNNDRTEILRVRLVGNRNPGIAVFLSHDCVVRDCYLRNNGAEYANMGSTHSERLRIEGNTIIGNYPASKKDKGILLHHGYVEPTVLSNRIYNMKTGIYLDHNIGLPPIGEIVVRDNEFYNCGEAIYLHPNAAEATLIEENNQIN